MKLQFEEIKLTTTELRTGSATIVNKPKARCELPDKTALLSQIAKLETELPGQFDPALMKRAITLLTTSQNQNDETA